MGRRQKRTRSNKPRGAKVPEADSPPLASGHRRLQRWFLPLAALVLALLFYSLNSGITITNDGSHFALIDSIIERGSPALEDNAPYAVNDSATYRGRIFSDRNPGLALLGVGFYRALAFLSPAMRDLNHDPFRARLFGSAERGRITILMLIPALCGALLFVALFLLLRHMKHEPATSAVTAASVVLGTIVLRYSTVLYSHTLAALLVVLALLLLFRYGRGGRRWELWLGGFVLSYAVLVEHIVVLLFVPVIAHLLVVRRRDLLRLEPIAGFAAACALPMIVLAIYNLTCFDDPFSIAHFHHTKDKANKELSTLFVFSRVPTALWRLLVGAPREVVGRKDLLGLVTGSPFLIFALGAIPLALVGRARLRAEHTVLAVGFALVAIGAASNFAPYGGWDRDYRYFLVVVPLLAPFVALALDWDQRLPNGAEGRWSVRWVTWGVFVALLLYSARGQLAHVRHHPQPEYPSALVNLSAALVNVGLVAALAAAATLLWRVAVWWRGRTRTSP